MNATVYGQCGCHVRQPCTIEVPDAERKRLHRLLAAGRVVSPYCGVYADAAYWQTLTPVARMCHLAEALTRRHPRWIFAGLTAAALLGLEYSWSLLHDEHVYTAVTCSPYTARTHVRLRRIFVSRLSSVMIPVPTVAGQTLVRVTSPARTLVDCALRYPFQLVLGMADAAFRQGMTTPDEVTAECDRVRADCGPVFRMLYYADDRSENGGESLCRATLIERGFAVPELQHEFIDPQNTRQRRRVDFIWHTQDGRTIVLEYDGTGKYVDPAMTGRRSIQQVVAEEKNRDAMLMRAGVGEIVHVTYDEVVSVSELVVKLHRAGVPQAGVLPQYEIRRAPSIVGRVNR